MPYTKILDSDMPPVNIYLDSRDAKFKIGKNEMVFTIPKPISCNQYHKMELAITSAHIPISCYNIKAGRNLFVFKLTKVGEEETEIQIIIPEGNYSLTQMLTKLAELLTSSLAGNSKGNVSVSWDSFSNKASFTAQAGTIVRLMPTSTGARLLGFTPNKIHGGINNVITSDSMVDIRNIRNIYIRSDLADKNVAHTQVEQKNHIICKIPVNVGNYETQEYDPNHPQIVAVRNKSIKTFSISLEDDDHLPLDLNDMAFSLTLTIYFSQDKPDRPPVGLNPVGFKFPDGKIHQTLLEYINEILLRYEVEKLRPVFVPPIKQQNKIF